RLEPAERVEQRPEAAVGLPLRGEPELVRRDDRDQAEPDAGHVGVVADAGFGAAGRGRAEPDVVDRELVLAVGERLEPPPGVAGEGEQHGEPRRHGDLPARYRGCVPPSTESTSLVT